MTLLDPITSLILTFGFKLRHFAFGRRTLGGIGLRPSLWRHNNVGFLTPLACPPARPPARLLFCLPICSSPLAAACPPGTSTCRPTTLPPSPTFSCSQMGSAASSWHPGPRVPSTRRSVPYRMCSSGQGHHSRRAFGAADRESSGLCHEQMGLGLQRELTVLGLSHPCGRTGNVLPLR